EKGWWSAMPSGCRKGHFHRGFPVPHLGQFSIKGMVRLGAERLRAAPLWTYHYGINGTALDDLLGWPFLPRLALFSLRPPLPDDWAGRLAECDNLRNVSDLSLIDCHVTRADVRRLLDAWAGRHLRDLSLAARKGDGDEIAAALADHPT